MIESSKKDDEKERERKKESEQKKENEDVKSVVKSVFLYKLAYICTLVQKDMF